MTGLVSKFSDAENEEVQRRSVEALQQHQLQELLHKLAVVMKREQLRRFRGSFGAWKEETDAHKKIVYQAQRQALFEASMRSIERDVYASSVERQKRHMLASRASDAHGALEGHFAQAVGIMKSSTHSLRPNVISGDLWNSA